MAQSASNAREKAAAFFRKARSAQSRATSFFTAAISARSARICPHLPVPGKGCSRRNRQFPHTAAQNTLHHIKVTGGLRHRNAPVRHWPYGLDLELTAASLTPFLFEPAIANVIAKGIKASPVPDDTLLFSWFYSPSFERYLTYGDLPEKLPQAVRERSGRLDRSYQAINAAVMENSLSPDRFLQRDRHFLADNAAMTPFV